MLCIYWADLKGLTKNYDEKLNTLHESRAEKVKNYKMPEDKIRGLGAGLLLEKALEDYLKVNGENPMVKDAQGRYCVSYEYGPQGKPYLKEYPNVQFSLSHSGMRAMVALSDTEVGLDVQQMCGYKDKIVKRFYHKNEQEVLFELTDDVQREKLFYDIWCCKEAYIKYTGQGMGQDLRDFYADFKSDDIVLASGEAVAKYKILQTEDDGYCQAVVFHKKITNIDKFIKILL
ncbi:MAG: 4'-phosphopantetheinyl transferase superfamily protein [Lachnospiraceae bacterium]|nr:4'-phosphopantetheinyl transferase superfamily protein [Lachnospiraceae bacterium]